MACVWLGINKLMVDNFLNNYFEYYLQIKMIKIPIISQNIFSNSIITALKLTLHGCRSNQSVIFCCSGNRSTILFLISKARYFNKGSKKPYFAKSVQYQATIS